MPDTFYPVLKTEIKKAQPVGRILWSEGGCCPGLLARKSAAPSAPVAGTSSSGKPPSVHLGRACGVASEMRFLLFADCAWCVSGSESGVFIVSVGFGDFPFARVWLGRALPFRHCLCRLAAPSAADSSRDPRGGEGKGRGLFGPFSRVTCPSTPEGASKLRG